MITPLLCLLSLLLFTQPRTLLGFAAEAQGRPMFTSLPTKPPKFSSTELLPSQPVPSLSSCKGLLPSQVWDFASVLVEIHGVPAGPFLFRFF